ncbi:MAG TPA: sulfite exporter TauE/SafE family protein [Nevskia sp.]|nr:sulfite exporter TauE/SafE family protein [Nevskia sp.]
MWIPGSTLGAPALFLAGTASSIHCGLMCGALGVHHARAGGALPAGAALAWLHGGRILGYGLLGALAGAAGQSLLWHLPRVVTGQVLQAFAALCLVLVGARMLAGRGRNRACCVPRSEGLLRRCPPRLNLLLRGLLWALIPCGLLYSLLLLAALSGGALSGALLTAAFACGGAPLLAGIGWSGRNREQRPHHGAGWWLIGLGLVCLAAALLLPAGLAPGWCEVPGRAPA